MPAQVFCGNNFGEWGRGYILNEFGLSLYQLFNSYNLGSLISTSLLNWIREATPSMQSGINLLQGPRLHRERANFSFEDSKLKKALTTLYHSFTIDGYPNNIVWTEKGLMNEFR
jgi:hypothetical protein